MGCVASTGGAERRRRVRALRHSEASTVGLLAAPAAATAAHHGGNGQQEPAAAGRRRGCKVAPEPEDAEPAAEALSMPGSPSFRFYCEKAAAIDALVAAADGSDSDASVRIKETPQSIRKNALAHNTSDMRNPKDANRWLKFRGLTIVAAALYGLFNRHSSAAAKSRRPCAAPAPAAAAAVSHP